jgi:hypothetical protein
MLRSIAFLIFTSSYCILLLQCSLKAVQGFTQNVRFCSVHQKSLMHTARNGMENFQLDGSSLIVSVPVESFFSSSLSRNDGDSRSYYVVELFEKTQLRIGILIRFKFSVSNKEHMLPTRAEIALIDSNFSEANDISFLTVDVGQITTIWTLSHPHHYQKEGQEFLLPSLLSTLAKDYTRAQLSLLQDLPVRTPEITMEKLYNSYKGRGRNHGKNSWYSTLPLSLRENDAMVKRLNQQPRIVSSQQAAAFLYRNNDENSNYQRIAGAIVLYQDAKFGGRFKRVPCVAASFSAHNNNTSPSETSSGVVHIVNGGWLAVDNSLKKAAEGRKFAQHASYGQSRDTFSDDTHNNQTESVNKLASVDTTTKDAVLLTEADERIARKLECLAMGEQIYGMDHKSNGDERMLEVDVRTALQAMSLPVTSEGAQEALITLGRWSKADANSCNSTKTILPWSKDIINAAKEFIEYNEKLKRILLGDKKNLLTRKDLTKFPSICIDSTSTKFRDDAVGVRPRSKELIIEGAGKWEILVHIADVSDLYSPNPITTKFFPSPSSILKLRNVAACRGLSRYDLPYGPLHLLPPILLESLALQTTSMNSANTNDRNPKVMNRCVTFWAYIDERNGTILDSGLERTLISSPISLSYNEASELLSQPLSSLAKNNTRKSNRDVTIALLHIIDRIFSAWATRQLANNEVYQKRQHRLKARELVSQETFEYDKSYSSASFNRTSGHMIVDRALDLYASGVTTLLRQKRARIPRASGAGEARGGRLGTGPLRRYIDGIAQRQALSVLCHYGGPPMTESECKEANNVAAVAYNAIDNYSAIKGVEADGESRMTSSIQMRKRVRNNTNTKSSNIRQQNRDLRLLAGEMAKRSILLMKERNESGGVSGKFVRAMATGRQNEVIISGVGTVVKCKGVEGTLSPGERVVVEIIKLNSEEGRISVKLIERSRNSG